MNPLAGTAGEQLWAEYGSRVVPEPDTGLLVALGLAGIAWTGRRPARSRLAPVP